MFEPLGLWCSVTHGNTMPTHWPGRLPEAGLPSWSPCALAAWTSAQQVRRWAVLSKSLLSERVSVRCPVCLRPQLPSDLQRGVNICGTNEALAASAAQVPDPPQHRPQPLLRPPRGSHGPQRQGTVESRGTSIPAHQFSLL